ncbi:MAG TPA: HDOD domain-containing protein [Rubrivivax sp.]|nr:HDOD domain-containing protein [Rubrivivax sp.]
MNPPPAPPPADPTGIDASMARSLGRFRLLRLVGKSQLSMAWRVHEGDGEPHARECFLLLPRAQPPGADAVQRWERAVRRASRLQHPNLAAPVEIGSCERWPYALYDATGFSTLDERMQGKAIGANEACTMLAAVLQGLAFAHDGGVVHRDIQPCMVLLGELGVVRLMGLEVALHAPGGHHDTAAARPARTSIEALALHSQREAARADVLCAGLLLHLALSGQPALGEDDVGALAQRLPPTGRDLVRLPWDIALPVPEALRAITNRSTDRQQRQRYRSARGLLRALEGWLQVEGAAGGGPLALLIDRLHSVGSLPASPGSTARAARLALMERQRTNELAEVVLQDLALSFELLRWVNSAQVRGAQAAGSGPVLTVRRSIAMLGLDGVRRAALGLRPWPGPLSEDAAQALRVLFDAAKRAARVAQALRPAGYDAEVVHLVTLLQNLGRLITGYHFPDELQQIRRLMLPAPAARSGDPDEPGMSEQAASYAVLGADIEAIGAAVARFWGLDDTVLHLIRRLPLSTTPRAVDNDDDMLRTVASCSNEAVDALALAGAQRQAALRRVAQRYGRALHINLRDLMDIVNVPTKGLDGAYRGDADADADADVDADADAEDRQRATHPKDTVG